ncbi:hypothetical protein BGZ54_007105 [Gamsiella multidivaricata]|nr:hypothetical protein BGZ54_007105 [Gamsiella multidivaricata]
MSAHPQLVGEGYETLESACRLAQQHPNSTVLVVMEDDIRSGVMRRVVQWIQRILGAEAQRLWTREALRAVPVPAISVATNNSTVPRETDVTFSKARPIDLSLLPTNLCIVSSLCATKILIDKPVVPQPAAASPSKQTVRRFSSFKSDHFHQSNLTINTASLTPARTVGLEVKVTKGLKDARYQLFCKDGIVFANNKHPLMHSLNNTTTPPTSRDGPARRRTSSVTSEDVSQWPRMVFSITMQHLRHQGRGIGIQITTAYHQLLTSASLMLDRLLRSNIGQQGNASDESQAEHNNISLQPVLLYQSDKVVHNVRVGHQSQEGDDTDESLRLEITASTKSLEPSAPIQIQVTVVTQPVAQDAFGNTETIRKGEAVLIEGLDMARQMAKAAGWTCLAEDDCQMVEWVRDQMSIQWSNDSVARSSTLMPVCRAIDGLSTFARSRTFSNGNSRVRTPNLSPYASRTQSYRGKKHEELGLGERRDSTLERLQEVTNHLERHEDKTQESVESHLRAKVTIAAVENPASQRPGLKTSFGGFSSLSDSRMATLALAEATEDHLGMALSIPSSPNPQKEQQQQQQPQEMPESFSEGIGPLDYLSGATNSKPATPELKKLSRFSIKSYRMERDKHGLSDEWAIGGGLGLSFGGGGAPATTTTTSDLLSTPPLVADVGLGLGLGLGLSGVASPTTPSPEHVPAPDFLRGLDTPMGGVNGRKTSFQSNRGSSQYNSLFGSNRGNSEEQVLSSNLTQDSNLIDNCGRRSISSFGNGRGSFGLSSNSSGPSSLEAPVELVHDFLGDSFAVPSPTKSSLISRPKSEARLDRGLSAPVTTATTTKTVHFADNEVGSGKLQRVQSEPMKAFTAGSVDGVPYRQQDETHGSGSGSGASSPGSGMSKSKAHTRRSWGQGIGGKDILGIQGLE